MCKPLPYPRCSNHARTKKNRTRVTYDKVRAAHQTLVDSGADEATLQASAAKVLKASEAHNKAWAEWEETPEGLATLQEREDALMAQEKARPAYIVRRKRWDAEARRDAKIKLGKEMEAAKATQEEDTARHLQKAQEAEKQAAESWERSDTDGSLTQWSSSMTAELERTRAEIASNGGTAEFPALFDTEGNLVPAKRVRTQYGMAWGLLSDPDDPRSSFTGWVNESQASTPEKRAKALERKGYRIGRVKAPAGAELDAPQGATGLSGATSVYVKTYRRDGGFSKDVEVVHNGQQGTQ